MALEEHVRSGLERLSEQRTQLSMALQEEIDKQKELHETKGKPEPPLHTDTRAVSILGLKSSRLHWDFVNEYVNGTPHDRTPYLDEIFKDMRSFEWKTDVAAPGSIESDLVTLAEYTGKFCYIQNIMTDNPEYVAEHYPTPASRAALDVAMDFSTAVSPLLSHVLAENGYNLNLEHRSPEELQQNEPKAVALLRAQTAEHVYKLNTGLAKKTEDTTLHVQFNQGINKNLCFIGKSLEQIQKHLESGGAQPRLNSPFWNDAANTFDCLFGAIGPTTYQGRKQAEAGMDQFDMIFIDGKSVRELCSDKYKNASPAVLSKLMQGEAIQAVTSGKNRVEMATIHGNNVQVSPVQANLRGIEPSVKEDYSAVRRLFNWGPFRCKTRTEQIEDLASKDKDPFMRQARIASKCLRTMQANQQARHKASPSEEKAAAKEESGKERSSLGHLMDEEKKTDAHRAARAPEQRTRAPQPVREKGGKDDHAL